MPRRRPDDDRALYRPYPASPLPPPSERHRRSASPVITLNDDDVPYGEWPPSPIYRSTSPSYVFAYVGSTSPVSPLEEQDDRPPPSPYSYSYPRRRSPPSKRFLEELEAERRGYAYLAVKRHNRDRSNAVKYSLVEIVGMGVFSEGGGWPRTEVHLNLRVRAKSGGPRRPDELVFAELRALGEGTCPKALTAWRPLDGKKQIPGRSDVDCGYHEDEDRDWRYCYACDDKIMHPEGWKYKAGHLLAKSTYCNDSD